VIKESLRLSFGAVSGQNRVVGPDDMEIAGVLVPAGVSSRPLARNMVYANFAY
jgi:hypothetical protein